MQMLLIHRLSYGPALTRNTEERASVAALLCVVVLLIILVVWLGSNGAIIWEKHTQGKVFLLLLLIVNFGVHQQR